MQRCCRGRERRGNHRSSRRHDLGRDSVKTRRWACRLYDQKGPFAAVIQRSQAAQGSIAMKIRFLLVLLIVDCMGGSYASTVESPTSVVRVQRAESNAAIKTHDAVRLRKLFDDDYHGIQGT